MDVLSQKNTNNPITGHHTCRHKNKLIKILSTIKVQGELSDITYKRFIPQVHFPTTLMVSLNFTNKAPHLGPMYPTMGWSPMDYQAVGTYPQAISMSLPHQIRNTQHVHQVGTGEVHFIIWCEGPLHIRTSGPWPSPPSNINYNRNRTYNSIAGPPCPYNTSLHY